MIWTVWGFNHAPQTSSASGSPQKVHVAFGFHVNLYHSFRGDTNNENGFGQNIRVIRHTLCTLDDFNGRGILVRAVWDFDNLFSLQQLLPEHTLDIITDVQHRVKENIDAGWEAVAPLEFRFSTRADAEHPFIIHERNFLGKEDAYSVDYYRHSPNNLNIEEKR